MVPIDSTQRVGFHAGMVTWWARLGVVVAMLWASAALAGASTGTPQPAQALPLVPIVDGQFVSVFGSGFQLGGLPFRFVGANINPIHGETDRHHTEPLFAAMVKDGLQVARVWALGEGMPDATEWQIKYVLFRAGPERTIEETLLHLDRVLLEARRAGVRLILTLSNNWADFGGVPMYLRWLGLSAEGSGKEAFYSDERAHALFRAHVGRIVTRVSSLTGIRYSDDPTIMAWELMNESTVDTPHGRAVRLAWVREMARFIKTFDHNHLVAAGLWGYAMRSERADFAAVHSLPDIDYVDSHLYMQNGQGNASLLRMYDLLDDRALVAARIVKKPLVIGEFGFRTDQGPTYLGLPRARWFAELLSRHFQNHGAGALAWIYEPFKAKPRDFGIYIDRSSTDDVRAVMRSFGHKTLRNEPFAENPRLQKAAGDGPLYQVDQVLHGSSKIHAAWHKLPSGDLALRIPPSEFRSARFERLGFWDGKPAAHFYGAESGDVEFRFALPTDAHALQALSALVVEARLSAEWPGVASPPDGGSLVRVELDGTLIEAQKTAIDDGRGGWLRFTLGDQARLRSLVRGEHTLRFVVLPGPLAHGLCIYGDARDPALDQRDFGPLRILLRGPAPVPKK